MARSYISSDEYDKYTYADTYDVDDEEVDIDDTLYEDDMEDDEVIKLLTEMHQEIDVIVDSDRVYVVSIENDGSATTLLNLSVVEAIGLSELLSRVSYYDID